MTAVVTARCSEPEAPIADQELDFRPAAVYVVCFDDEHERASLRQHLLFRRCQKVPNERRRRLQVDHFEHDAARMVNVDAPELQALVDDADVVFGRRLRSQLVLLIKERFPRLLSLAYRCEQESTRERREPRLVGLFRRGECSRCR